uniref:Alternative protein ODZ4 n=1 Tax=Homo sapiens TaxID=9606 RepID=L8EC75_HUMAN|nr:alternative protein ODZ4 [Homo sapiens]
MPVIGWSSMMFLFISSFLPKPDVRTSTAQQAFNVGTMSTEQKATHGKGMAVVARAPACLPRQSPLSMTLSIFPPPLSRHH